MRRPLLLLSASGFIALALALTALGAGAAVHAGHQGGGAPISDLSALWAVPPVEVAATLVAGGVYWAVLRARPGVVAPWRRWCFAAGLAVLLGAVVSPLAGAAQQGLLTAHMLQHTLIGAVAPLLLLLGVPRALACAGEDGPWRRRLRRVQHPGLAFALWAVGTIVWLLPAVHHAVLESAVLWVAQQASFLLLGLLLWAPVVESLPAPGWFGTTWKGSYMTGVWTVGLAIANVYWFSGTSFYDSHAAAAAAWGVEPLEDQANSGTVMMVVHCLLAFGAIAVLFFRQAREGDLRQRLLEAGLDPARVEQAIRAGSGERLAEAHGLSTRMRPGID